MYSSAKRGEDTELYTNQNTTSKYKYARPFQTNVEYETRDITVDGQERLTISVTGVPDGVSPDANEAVVLRGTPRRLYIFSDRPLNDYYINVVDQFYGTLPYPMLQASTPCATLSTVNVPRNNFYLTHGPPSVASHYVEYRYLQKRHHVANIAFDERHGTIYRLVLPSQPLMVIIMPANFIRTGLKSGYFVFKNNLVVRVYSKYLLSGGEHSERDTGLVSVISTEDKRLMAIVQSFFGRMGMHKIGSTGVNQIYAYDQFMTMVVGSTANLALP